MEERNEQHIDNVDVAICGAGPVGLALAALLVQRGVAGSRIALIDARALGQAISDPRSIALAWGSRQLLEEVKAWPFPSTPIHTIHVSRRGQLGRSLLDRSEHKLEALGYVTRYGEVVDALARAVDRAGVQVIRPARVAALDETADHVSLSLDDGRTVRAQVVVGAEGGVFGQQEDKGQTRDYGQSAVIARVSPAARSRTAPSNASRTRARWPCCRRKAPTASNMRWSGACSPNAPKRCRRWKKDVFYTNWAKPLAAAWGALPKCRRAFPTRSA
jgi:2-polyprenyl-6-methoxyphenol hydroxylase-like FAD-dependent oxidoreductase